MIVGYIFFQKYPALTNWDKLLEKNVFNKCSNLHVVEVHGRREG